MADPTRAPTADASAAPTPAPPPPASARVETSAILLDLAVGPGYEQPAATTPGVGGLTSRGPTSVAVDADGRIYLWDQARVRILVYEGGRLGKVLPQPFVEQASGALLAYAGRLYLRYAPNPEPYVEYEIDAASGDLLRLGTRIYPREREPLSMFDSKGPTPPMGRDAFGNRYDRTWIPHGSAVSRTDPAGTLLATGTSATTDHTVDSYVAADGTVLDLRQSVGASGRAEGVRVVRMLGPAGAVPPEKAPAAVAGPTFAGRAAPSRIEVLASPQLPPATLGGLDARSVWWTLTYARRDPHYATLPAPTRDAYRLRATWPDGSALDLAFDGSVLDAGRDRFGTPALLTNSLPHVLARPAFLIDALRENGARVRIADLPGVERTLGPAEVDAFAVALGSAFPTTFYERYRPLEDPFPRRQLVIEHVGGTVVLQDVGDRYLRADRMYGAAWVHDGRASALLRQWLPVPALSADGVAALYAAERVTLPDQDISRWKATIVRALALPSAATGQGTWDAQGPLTFTFTFADGRSEVVRVDANGFTLRGRTYARKGLLDLHGLKGVP